MLSGIHVNIFDLVAHERLFRKDPETPMELLKRFKNVKTLARYSKETDKIYPRDLAKRQGALKFMLRHLFK